MAQNDLMNPRKWCLQAQIFAVLVLLGLVLFILGIGDEKMVYMSKGSVVISSLVSGFITLCALLYLCEFGYDIVAWVVLLLPIVAGIIMAMTPSSVRMMLPIQRM